MMPTNLFSRVEDPADLDLIRDVIAKSERPEALVPLGIRRMTISPDASTRVVDELTSLLREAGRDPQGGRVVVVMDDTTIMKGDTDLKDDVTDRLRAVFEVAPLVLDGGGHLLADDTALDAATAALDGAVAVVSVGSGTISDIAKVASTRVGGVPHVLVQTAASVDGYTDNVSVVLRAGAKRTIPSRWPDVVLADTEVIASAPRALNTAGFGELLSLFTAPADWWLASQVGADASFHTTPRDLLLTFAGDPSQWGRGIGDGARPPIEQLTQVLAIRGIGTGIAGSTACLSGVEHLVSHMLDMYATAHGHVVGLHGAQVGVASLVAASAWEYLLLQLRSTQPMTAVERDEEAVVLSAFVECDPRGALGAECWNDYRTKLVAWESAGSRVSEVIADPDLLEQRLGAMLPDRHRLALALVRAGAPASRTDLGEWVSADIWRWAVSNCLFMRNRVTVIDLLDACGWWSAADVDTVLRMADDALASARANGDR